MEPSVEELKNELAEKQQVIADLQKFVHRVAHDLRSPVNTVSSVLQVLLKRFETVIGADGKEMVGLVWKDLQKMGLLISNLVLYSELGAERKTGSVVLCDVVENAYLRFAKQIEEVGGRVELELHEQVEGSEEELTVVFQKLFENSFHFRHPDRALEIVVRDERLNGEVEVSFSDNGIGFESEYGEQAFDLFTKFHGPALDGGGLGLAVVKKAVELNDGSVRLETAPDCGTKVILRLPREGAET